MTKITNETVLQAMQDLDMGDLDTKKLNRTVARKIARHLNNGQPVSADAVDTVLSYLDAIKEEADPKRSEKASAKATDTEAEPDDEAKDRKELVQDKYKKLYKETSETKTGCGDEFDVAFHKETDGVKGDDLIGVLNQIGEDNDIDVQERWGHLTTRNGTRNGGMMRMNLSNVLRALHKKGVKVKIGKKTYHDKDAAAAAKAKADEKAKKEKAKAEKKEARDKAAAAKKAEKEAKAA